MTGRADTTKLDIVASIDALVACHGFVRARRKQPTAHAQWERDDGPLRHVLLLEKVGWVAEQGGLGVEIHIGVALPSRPYVISSDAIVGELSGSCEWYMVTPRERGRELLADDDILAHMGAFRRLVLEGCLPVFQHINLPRILAIWDAEISAAGDRLDVYSMLELAALWAAVGEFERARYWIGTNVQQSGVDAAEDRPTRHRRADGRRDPLARRAALDLRQSVAEVLDARKPAGRRSILAPVHVGLLDGVGGVLVGHGFARVPESSPHLHAQWERVDGPLVYVVWLDRRTPRLPGHAGHRLEIEIGVRGQASAIWNLPESPFPVVRSNQLLPSIDRNLLLHWPLSSAWGTHDCESEGSADSVANAVATLETVIHDDVLPAFQQATLPWLIAHRREAFVPGLRTGVNLMVGMHLALLHAADGDPASVREVFEPILAMRPSFASTEASYAQITRVARYLGEFRE